MDQMDADDLSDDGLVELEATPPTGEEFPREGEGEEDEVEEEQNAWGEPTGEGAMPFKKSWRVDHSTGNYRFRANRFIEKVLSEDFQGADAIRMLQEKNTIDFGSSRAGGAEAKESDDFYPQFHLDFLSIVGKPGRPISRTGGLLFDNTTISFMHWAAPYGAKHISGITFDLTGRTFRIAQAATREVWFIVMHPVTGEMAELPQSAAQNRRKKDQAAAKSGMPMALARPLAAYITHVFRAPKLVGDGVEASWRPGGKDSQNISSSNWATFQELFMNGWSAWASRFPAGTFWREHVPAFHAYDYGANIKIEVESLLYDIPRERHTLQRGDDEEMDSDEEERYAPRGVHGGRRRSISGLAGSSSGIGDEEDEEEEVEQEEEEEEEEEEEGEDADMYDYDGMIRRSKDLEKLNKELGDRFSLEEISSVSYAFAVCINSVARTEAGGEEARCLLVDRNKLATEYTRSSDYTFYPQAFHPSLGNVTSKGPPAFLESLFSAMRGNASRRNEGADVLSFGYFQGYSNIKRNVRHSPQSLLATKGYATAALTVPAMSVCATPASRDKRERLLNTIRGRGTPENPDESRPFARERRQIMVAIETGEVAYRLEQVVSVNVGRMKSKERTFEAVIQPIFQMMRFFLVERESYIGIFRSIPPEVFPKIMCAYSRLFELALGEMERRFVQGGERGLDLAQSEAVAVMDRLGGYIFTGHPRHLPNAVLRALGTMDSLQRGAWPYIDKSVLDIGAEDGGSARAVINLKKWPWSSETGRPMLIHVGELQYHYGARIAMDRESELWFAIMGDDAFRSKTAVAEFIGQVLAELWVPQTKTFLARQLQRRIHRGGLANGERIITSENVRAYNVLIEKWETSKAPFGRAALRRLVEGLKQQGFPSALKTDAKQTRHDFARDMLKAIRNDIRRLAYSSKNATWPLKIRIAMQRSKAAAAAVAAAEVLSSLKSLPPSSSRNESIRESDWEGALTGQLLHLGIEWVPGAVSGRMTSAVALQLRGTNDVLAPASAAPGTLLRAAQEAEIREAMARKMRARRGRGARIDFGCGPPFKAVPPLIQAGFRAARATFTAVNGDRRVLDHYQLAMDCLAANIEDASCQLMLMLTLTICSSSQTPQVTPGQRVFSVSSTRRDTAGLALGMATRMMWHLYPKFFPWEKNSGGTAYDVGEMTKKIEHKGCSNRMLLAMGWVTTMVNRATPRNNEVTIVPHEERMERLRALQSALKRPDEFISIVFHCESKQWVDRCEDIITQL